ncbi:MAG: PBP1A family penicillin-binding protein [Mariprofundaceae bacterium]|nr:PBP1A family penicillin-binding protein [Mariprofundaceae bacterium]
MRFFIIFLKITLTLTLSAMIVVTAAYLHFASSLPKLDSIASYRPPLASRVYNNNGKLLAEYADEHRLLVPLEDMPKHLKDAFITTEDEQFYKHPGFNPARILSAFYNNIKQGRVVQGASTITQQVVKNFLLSPERTWQRKVREIILSYRLEQTFSKNEILYLYLNQIYLGRGSHGVGSAAWRYYRKTVDELNLAESAMLAALPKAPSKYAPHLNPSLAKERRDIVLRRMLITQFSDKKSVEDALNTPLNIQPLPQNKLEDTYGHSVYQQLEKEFGKENLRRQGLTIITPYTIEAQQVARHALRKGVLNVEGRQFYRTPPHHEPEKWPALFASWKKARSTSSLASDGIFPGLIQRNEAKKLTVHDGIKTWQIKAPKWSWKKNKQHSTWLVGDEVLLRIDQAGKATISQTPSIESALFSIDLEKGTVLAEVGGFNYKFGRFNRVQQAKRQPGSSFKPFLYFTGMSQDLTPATIIMDTPLVFPGQNQGKTWTPKNYKNNFAGPVTIRNALEHSRNLVSIKILQDVGIDTFLNTLENFHFEHRFPRQLSLALGASEVSLEKLTESYTVLATLGQHWKPVRVQQVQDRKGHSLIRAVAGHRCQTCHINPVIGLNKHMLPAKQTVDAATAFVTVNMMKGVIQHGTGVRARALKRPAAGKTGTTNDQIDAWFMGFTPQVLTGVWVGKDQPSTLGRRETGGKAALPIWLETMQFLHKGKPVKDFKEPEGISWVLIDKKSGYRTRSASAGSFLEAFRSGTEPTRFKPRPVPSLESEGMEESTVSNSSSNSNNAVLNDEL